MVSTFLWWEMCRGRKEQVWNVPGWKLLMSTVFHNVFPDSFQGKYIIQNHLRLIVLKHVWHLATGCQVVLTSLGGGGGLGLGLFILLRKSSLNRNYRPAQMLRTDLKDTKFPAEFNVDAERKNQDTEIWICVCVRGICYLFLNPPLTFGIKMNLYLKRPICMRSWRRSCQQTCFLSCLAEIAGRDGVRHSSF